MSERMSVRKASFMFMSVHMSACMFVRMSVRNAPFHFFVRGHTSVDMSVCMSAHVHTCLYTWLYPPCFIYTWLIRMAARMCVYTGGTHVSTHVCTHVYAHVYTQGNVHPQARRRFPWPRHPTCPIGARRPVGLTMQPLYSQCTATVQPVHSQCTASAQAVMWINDSYFDISKSWPPLPSAVSGDSRADLLLCHSPSYP